VAVGLACLSAALIAAPARTETIQEKNLVVTVNGGIVPKKLPRRGRAPVSIRVAGKIATTDGLAPPQLRQFELEVNRHGRVFDRGLPRCRRPQLEDATTAQALRACRGALVGRGRVLAEVALPDQAPFPADGALLAFNARDGGRRAVLGHVYGTTPLPVTTVVPFRVGRARGRTFGARLTAELPTVAAEWGYVTDFAMRFGRRYREGGERRSYLNAGCPAPRGFPGALFDAVRASYRFEGGQTLETTLQRACTARGR
jgi:hypothetical protein